MSTETLRWAPGEAAFCAFTGQIQLVHAQAQLMELQLLQLMHCYASSVENFGMRRFVADELGLLLGLSSRSTELMLQDAELLMDHPSVLAKVADGDWALKHAHAALTTLAGSGLDREQQQQAVALVLSQGARTPWEVRKAMQAAILITDPEAAARRHDKAVADRGVSLDASREAGTLFAHGSVSQVRSLMAALEAQVGPAGPEETRNHAQRLFDLLMDLVCGRAEAGQWQAYVVMTLDTLTGASQQPAEIPGLGLIPANEARDLAARAELRRVVVDENGELVSIDSTVARPDAPAADTTPAAERRASTQVEDAVCDDEPATSADDLAWHHAQLDAQTPADADAGACPAADPEIGSFANLIELCPEALDRALEELLNGLVPAGSVATATADTHDAGHVHDAHHFHHAPPARRGPPPPSPGPGADRPDPSPPPDGPPRGHGPRPPAPPTPAAPTGAQLDPDVPPSPGDLAWDDDTTDYTSFDSQVPPRRYQREPGSRHGGGTVPSPTLWTPTGLRAALSRMLTAKLDPRPLRSTSYALPPRMARHIKTRDLTCTFPGCQRLAQTCQNDHVVPWPTGKSEQTNMASECTHHHQSKTERFFHVHKNAEGTHWTTRAGRTYTRPPRPLLRGW